MILGAVLRCAAAGVLALGATSLAGCGCSGIPSCVPQIAVRVTARAQSGVLTSVVAELVGSGQPVGCPLSGGVARCELLGSIATYEVEVRAPGYETARRTVRVDGDVPECSCPEVDPEDLLVVLTPLPSSGGLVPRAPDEF